MVLTRRRILNLNIASVSSLGFGFALGLTASCTFAFAGDGVSSRRSTIDPALNQVRILMREKRFNEASAPLDAYLRKFPNSSVALIYRSRCYVDDSKYPQAIQCLAAAEKVDPTNSEVYASQAEIYATLKQYDKALAASSASIKYRKGYQNKQMFHLRSMMYSALGQYKKAIEDMSTYLRIDPEKHRAYMWRGTAYEQDGQLDKALADYEVGLDKSKSYEYRFHIARVLQKKGRMSDAIAQMTALIKQNPDEDEAWNKRATLYFESGKYKEAISDYTEAIETNFGAGETLYRARGKAYEKLGKRDLAQRDFKKAEELQRKPTVSPI